MHGGTLNPPGNIMSGRTEAVGWINGNSFWIYGGTGVDVTDKQGKNTQSVKKRIELLRQFNPFLCTLCV